MLNKKHLQSIASSDNGADTISGDFWDETSWISSTEISENFQGNVSASNHPSRGQPKIITALEGKSSQCVGNQFSSRSISSQTSNSIGGNQFSTQIFSAIITISFQLLYTGDEKRKYLSILISAYYAIMLYMNIAVTKTSRLKSNLITDLFNAALSLCHYTFLIVVTDILSDGWQILNSTEFRVFLWDRIQFACLLQAESWIISRLVISQVLGLGILLTIIVSHILFTIT